MFELELTALMHLSPTRLLACIYEDDHEFIKLKQYRQQIEGPAQNVYEVQS